MVLSPGRFVRSHSPPSVCSSLSSLSPAYEINPHNGKPQAMIMARNKEKSAKYKTGPSSEDIWKIRKEPLESSFTGIPVDVEAGRSDTAP